MINNYELAEIAEVGKAHEVILGSSKVLPLVDDGPGQPRRESEMEDDE
jgi:hypothetical protein